MLSSNNIKNILTSLFNKSKEEHDKEFNHLETRMNEGWISSGTIENIRGNSFESDILLEGPINEAGTYELSNYISNYDLILVDHIYLTSSECAQSNVYYTKDLIGRNLQCNHGNSSVSNFIEFSFTENSMVVTSYGGETINRIIGIKNTNINISMYDGTHYSEDELLIGQWIDGKPLYRKVVKLPDQNTRNTRVNSSNLGLNIDSIIHLYGTADYVHDGSILKSMNIPHYLESNAAAGFRYMEFDGIVSFGSVGYSYTFKNIYAVLEYTKSTDTPFSVDEDIAWVALDSDVNDVLNNIGE